VEVPVDQELSRRVERALRDHPCTPAERRTVMAAAARVEHWDDLPDEIRKLVREIEARSYPLGLL
jgi:hypothetical protein